MKFKEILFKHQGYISDKYMNYLDIYSNLFDKLKNENFGLLEIGVQNGGSLQIV